MNAQTTARTAGPWASAQDGVNCLIYRGKPDKNIAVVYNAGAKASRHREEGVANADFIVRACNAHDELVAALRQIERASTGQMDQSDDDIEQAFAGIHNIARAALAKVTP